MSTENRKPRAPQSIRQLMSSNEPGFGKVLQRARAIEQLNQSVMALLPDDLMKGCRVANVRDGKMIFSCSSSGIATRLRMQSNQLLRDLQAAGMTDIQSVEIKMMMPGSG